MTISLTIKHQKGTIMEHIVQFGINIDDETIRKVIERRASEDVLDEIKCDIENRVINGYGGLSCIAEDIINKILENRKDEIIEKASVIVADSVKRSKKYRNMLADIMENAEKTV